ncbi:hypothetical protein F5I97DRAFT_1806197, partial [Phlebopus sp. FC_14]
DDYENVHPDIINKYYDVDSPQLMRQARQTRAGHPENEDEDFVIQDIAAQQMQQARHEAVCVLSAIDPFIDQNSEDVFYTMLHELIVRNITPDNFGLRTEEWEDGHYPTYEIIHIGRQELKDLHVSLADLI